MALNVEAFYDAINSIAKRQVQSTPADLTIDAEIANIYNVDIGEYKVEYQGNIFSAFSTDPTVVYKKGEKVYILVPQGDYSNKKVILGRSAYNNQLTYQDMQDMTNFFIEAGPNWASEEDGTYPINYNPLQICAVPQSQKENLDFNMGAGAYWEDQGFRRFSPEEERELRDSKTRYPASYLSEEEIAPIDLLFQNYARTYSWLKIEAKFRTDFNSVHTTGRYSLVATFIADNPQWREKEDPQYEQFKDEPRYIFIPFELGFVNFNGAPYQLVVDTPQKAYFEITPGELKGLYKVSLLQDGALVYDVIPTYDDGGNLVFKPENSVKDRNNIFCSDIDIRFCQKVNLMDTLYYVWIETPYGDAVYDADGVVSGRESVTLIPHMVYTMQEVTKDCEIMWFREDLRIPEIDNPSSADKDEDGMVWTDYTGPGWRPISQFVDENNKNYIENADGSLTVLKNGVTWQWRFKLVCKYLDRTWGEAIVTVRRTDSDYNLEIEQLTSKNNLETMVRITDKKRRVGIDIVPGTKKTYPEWFGTWYYQLPDDSYNLLYDPYGTPGTYYHGPIALNHMLKYEHFRLRVACYDPTKVVPPSGEYDGNQPLVQVEEIGYLEYEVNAAEDGGLLINWEGIRSFNYTAAGICYETNNTKDHTLAPKINWVHGTALDYRITIFAPDGSQLGPLSYYNKNNDDPAAIPGEMTATGYNPSSSMMYDIYCDSNNVVHFKVRKEYDADRAQPATNTFLCVVHTISDNKFYEQECVVSFTKDGQQGTQGTNWTAPLKLTNTVEVRQGAYKEGEAYEHRAAPYTMELGMMTYPLILKRQNSGQLYEQLRDTHTTGRLCGTKVVLRPFITKDGKLLEELGDSEKKHYRVVVYWDVRYPQNAGNARARGASFLRLCNPDTGNYIKTERKDQIRGQMFTVFTENKNEDIQVTDGLCGVTEWYGNDPSYVNNHQYCAVEVIYCPGGGFKSAATPLTHEDVFYNFYVKATVEVETDLETKVYRKGVDNTYGSYSAQAGSWHRLKSFSAIYPIDVFIHDGDPVARFNPQKVYINWPQEILYDARGYNPIIDADYLEFYYGNNLGSALERKGNLMEPQSRTVEIQTVEKVKNPLLTDNNSTELTFAEKEYLSEEQYRTMVSDISESVYKLRPRSHLNWQEGTVGVLYTEFSEGSVENSIPKGTFFRNQIYRLNQYENIDINGWDGQGIDINEDNGTIFAPTIGAGFKGPLTNNFTGVIMGVNSAYPRESGGTINSFFRRGTSADPIEEAELQDYPFMTGLFGYQNGHASFGLLENGTAFFGRSDRGGRIIIDGYNATIYGGANGVFESPEIGDPMWNTMRLTFVDLTHAANGDKLDRKQMTTQGVSHATTGVNGVVQGFGGKFFPERQSLQDGINTSKLPLWYNFVWSHAYVTRPGRKPWWLGKNYGYVTYKDENDFFRSEQKYPDGVAIPYESLGSYKDYLAGKIDNARINYFHIDDAEMTLIENHENPKGGDASPMYAGFGSSRASTTPAIEIGQHIEGLMPGIIPWGAAESVMEEMYIPGNRNFLVTYDGTLWAMNAVIMGNVIGSNIIGGRMQGTEIGVGKFEWQDIQAIRINNGDVDDWPRLLPPRWTAFNPRNEPGVNGPFSVDDHGNVMAASITIYGGSIDIGGFHVLPSKNNGTVAGGELVQFGESDFIGPTHFYGNVGIGPNVSVEERRHAYGQPMVDKGNFIQVGGIALLGVLLQKQTAIKNGRWKNTEYIQNKDGTYTLLAGYQTLLNQSTDKEGMDFENLVYAPPFEDATTDPQNSGIFSQVEGSEEGEHIDSYNFGKFAVQRSIFGVNSTAKVYYDTIINGAKPIDSDPYLQAEGHFWPFYHRVTNQIAFSDNLARVEKEGAYFHESGVGLSAYMTTLDIFCSEALAVSNLGKNVENTSLIKGANYFRVGPWGMEFCRGYICQDFQPQSQSACPTVDRVYNDKGERLLGVSYGGAYGLGVMNNGALADYPRGGVRGYIGLVDRNASRDAPFAIGMTSWGNSPIIFNSDENMALRSNNWTVITAGKANRSKNSGRLPGIGALGGGEFDARTWTSGLGYDGKDAGTTTAAIQLGHFSGANVRPRIDLTVCDHGPNDENNKKQHPGQISLTIAANEGGETSEGSYTFSTHGGKYFTTMGLILGHYTEKGGSGVQANPAENKYAPALRGASGDENKYGIYLFSRCGDVHIIRHDDYFQNSTNTSKVCSDKTCGVTEILLKPKEITMYAREKVTIGWGENQSAHTDKFKKAVVFQDDGITVINDDGGSTPPGPDPSPGGGGTPPEPAGPSDNKYCIYLSGDDNTTNHGPELSLFKTFAGLHGPQVKIGAGSSPHNPTSYMLFTANAIDMKGNYANPDNQFHIYARFG